MSRKSPRRGSTATTLLLSLGATLGMSALTVDLGVAVLGRAEVQNSLDAGALAGAGYFDGKTTGVATATAKARAWVAANPALGQQVNVTQVEVGHSDASTNYQFVATSDPAVANALRLAGNLPGVKTPFAALFGTTVLNPAAQTVSRQPPPSGAGSEDCYLPLAVPDCVLQNIATFENKGFQFNSAQQDNTGWATLPPLTANASNVKGQIDAAGFCGGLGLAQAGSDVSLSNGELATALGSIGSAIKSSGTTWDKTKWGNLPQPQMKNSDIPSPKYGNVIQGPIILFHDDSGGQCASATQFNQTKKITGFVWGVLYDVSSTGGTKNIRMKLDLSHPYNVGNSGGGIGNVTFPEPPVIAR